MRISDWSSDVCSSDLAKRGVKMMRTYQLNTGGNTDFLNMKNHLRLESKRISKTEAVQAVSKIRIVDENIHIGPSDYVPWQNEHKPSFLSMEGRLFGDVTLDTELRRWSEEIGRGWCRERVGRGEGGWGGGGE